MELNDGPTTRCISCGRERPAEARICAECGSHQSRWRNEIVFVSTLVGILSVTVTSLAFLVSLGPELRAIVSWQDQVEVVELDGLGEIVLANRGDGPVYVSDVRIDPGPFSFVRRINAVIDAGEVGIFQPDSVFAAIGEGYRIPLKSAVPEFDPMSVPGYLQGDEACETLIVVSESSAAYRLWSSRMADEFPVLDEPATVVVKYHGVDSGRSHEDTLTMPTILGRWSRCDDESGG